MAAQPIVNSINANEPEYHFDYNAAANVLEADLEQPLREKIRPQAAVKLYRDGHYQYRQADPFRFEGILSYKGGYTQVAGRPSTKIAGYSTLSTSVVEGLNVLDVVTADRVVAQISTEHRRYAQVPSVTFLGTRFENLRIDGRPVEFERDLEILGPRREDDTSYFDDDKVQSRVRRQQETITKHLPEWATEEYGNGRSAINGKEAADVMKCSLIDGIRGCPGFSFGHVIDLPEFGKIFLGELSVERTPGDPAEGTSDKYRFRLTMIRLKMGCLADGTANVSTADSNGTGSQGGNKGGH